MSRIFHPLMYLLACTTRQELARQVHYLKVENEILRARLPKVIQTTPAERRRLIRAGKKLGTKISRLITIVQPETFLRWLRAEGIHQPRKRACQRKPGRPPIPDDIRAEVVRIARETGWGYSRILGELRKLGVRVSRQSVKNILVAEGFDPGPRIGAGTWDEFLKLHAATLWQCDFFSRKIWTLKGRRQCFVLAFVHVASRRVFLSPSCFKPDAAWLQAQGAAFVAHTRATGLPAELVTRDRDVMYRGGLDGVLRSAGIAVKAHLPQSPNLQAYVERFVQTIGQECLDHFVVLGQRHFDHLISEFVEYYLHHRPHQSLGNLPLGLTGPPPAVTTLRADEIVCHERLGGLLKHYERRAA
jgi:putative transposase